MKKTSIFKLPQAHWALVFAFLSLFVLGLADNIRGPLFPEILNYFNLSNVLGSWSFATTSGAAFLGSFISGYYLRRFSISSLLMLAMLSMASGLMVMGSAPDFAVLLVGSFILGLSIGFMGVSQNLLVAENVSEHNKTRALSALHATYGFASLLAPLLAAGATQSYGVWRAAFIITGGVTLIILIAKFLIQPDPAFGVHPHSIESAKEASSPTSLVALFMIGGMFAFYVVAEILVSTRLALYMRTYFQMDLEKSSQYVTYFFVFLLLGRLVFAFKKMSISLRAQMNISLFSALVFLILGLKYHPFFLALVGLGMAPYYPLCISYISEKTGIKNRTFVAFAMSFQSLSVVSMHLGVGYLTDHFSLFYAFGVGIFALLLCLLCLNFHPRKII